MSKFYDAMERSGERVFEAAPVQGKAIEQLEVISEKSKIETDGILSSVDPLEGSQDTGLSDECVEMVDSEVKEAPGPDWKRAESEVAEEPIHPAFERIIQKLLAFRRSPRQGVILVAGAVPGEGASTIARNTALSLRRGRSEKVVLVDSNIRNPSQHSAFQTELSDGLSDVLRGSVSLTSAVKAGVAPGLSMLTAGRLVGNPLHILTISALQGVVMALTSLFDWVIIDGPPVTTCPEANSLAAASGGALLVIQAENTRQEVAEEAKRVLEDSGVDLLGAVLNRRRFHIPAFIYRRL